MGSRSARPHHPTAPDDTATLSRARLARWWRRGFLSVLAVIVVLGATGWLGVRSATVTASNEGYGLSVTYASIARGGLAAPFEIEVTSPAGFEGPITLATTARYFDAFDENGLDPEPVEATSDGEWSAWTFARPTTPTFVVSFDARIGPSVEWGVSATTQLRIDEKVVVEVSYRTRVMP